MTSGCLDVGDVQAMADDGPLGGDDGDQAFDDLAAARLRDWDNCAGEGSVWRERTGSILVLRRSLFSFQISFVDAWWWFYGRRFDPYFGRFIIGAPGAVLNSNACWLI